MRGEYVTGNWEDVPKAELPPRARRIRGVGSGEVFTLGTTSACAENTHQRARESLMLRNYLRVRGEYYHCLIIILAFMELPPRARRIPLFERHGLAR